MLLLVGAGCAWHSSVGARSLYFWPSSPGLSHCELVSESLFVRTLASEYRSQSYAVKPRLHRRYFYIGPLTSSRDEDVNVSLGTTIQPPPPR